MAIVERPTPALELTTGEPVVGRPLGVFTRPQATTGWKSWLTTVDHKRIGIMYGVSALFFFSSAASRRCSSASSWPRPARSCTRPTSTTSSSPCTA